MSDCPSCKGRGRYTPYDGGSTSSDMPNEEDCPDCKGTGKISAIINTCPHCRATPYRTQGGNCLTCGKAGPYSFNPEPPARPVRRQYYPWNMPQADDCGKCGCRKHGTTCSGAGGFCGCGDYRPRGAEATAMLIATADVYDHNRKLVKPVSNKRIQAIIQDLIDADAKVLAEALDSTPGLRHRLWTWITHAEQIAHEMAEDRLQASYIRAQEAAAAQYSEHLHELTSALSDVAQRVLKDKTLCWCIAPLDIVTGRHEPSCLKARKAMGIK